MRRIAKFHKVSLEQFMSAVKDEFPEYSEADIKDIYENIELPKRATKGSAGYDFYSPVDVVIQPGERCLVWTDVKSYMQENEVLMLYVRSSIGVKKGVVLSNGTGIIDSSYYSNPGNDGNIGISLFNTSDKEVHILAGVLHTKLDY